MIQPNKLWLTGTYPVVKCQKRKPAFLTEANWPRFSGPILDLWFSKGCPETMRIHVKSTGQTIVLKNGLPVRENAEKIPLLKPTSKAQKRKARGIQPVRENRTCLACSEQFTPKSKDTKYCSQRCQKRAKRKQEVEEHRKALERLLA